MTKSTGFSSEVNKELLAHLFKVLPVSFCRNLAKHVKYDFYQRGDFIFMKNEVKDRMVYIYSGNVQILAADDDETALCSLSTGTCLGEASLVVGLINKFSVKCSSYCEVLSLEKRTFTKLIQNYPIFLRYILKRINVSTITPSISSCKEDTSITANDEAHSPLILTGGATLVYILGSV
ncbi:cyclic nucleotide-gated cation channel beta-3-like [Schistocerca americana]|uniref:cyclic nucleotide-gated cation channel beta-3-like n=1 Tax=Schistocerca americana TaxID=7009 RepID=UPI001F4F2E23|nr:cyclic nucleotide-gated cation channel beta-3-like [Schistocerca americana]